MTTTKENDKDIIKGGISRHDLLKLAVEAVLL
jgi:hypothetical protein